MVMEKESTHIDKFFAYILRYINKLAHIIITSPMNNGHERKQNCHAQSCCLLGLVTCNAKLCHNKDCAHIAGYPPHHSQGISFSSGWQMDFLQLFSWSTHELACRDTHFWIGRKGE